MTGKQRRSLEHVVFQDFPLVLLLATGIALAVSLRSPLASPEEAAYWSLIAAVFYSASLAAWAALVAFVVSQRIGRKRELDRIRSFRLEDSLARRARA